MLMYISFKLRQKQKQRNWVTAIFYSCKGVLYYFNKLVHIQICLSQEGAVLQRRESGHGDHLLRLVSINVCDREKIVSQL
jgi:hypothetical protein